MSRVFFHSCLSCFLVATSNAAILLDDTWSDGTRTDQNLPDESAWFASSGSALTASPGAMTLAMGSSAVLGVAYFGTNSSSPIRLEVGDTLTASITLTFNGVAPNNSSQGFRLGLFNFADSTLSPRWAAADGFGNSSQGSGVQGYTLFQNMGVTFNNSSPMEIRVRTNLTSSSLLSSSGDHKALMNGPGNLNGFPGFTNGIPYRLQLSVERSAANALVVTAAWLNPANGASLTTSVTDASATNFSFDGIACRPQNAASSSTNIVFSEVKVELTSVGTSPSINADPADQSVFVDQSATFLVDASGSTPLSYFWYYNTNTLVTNSTVPTLTLANVQPADAGEYFVVVSNSFGSVTSAVAILTVSTPTAPSIVTEPQSVMALPGETANFHVIAGGSEPLTYQWFFNTNTPLPNATDAILTLNNVQVTNAGMYSVIVSNLAGSIASDYAALTINTNPVAPIFTSQPLSQTVLLGGIANFSAVVSGTAPISYQWNRNGVAIAGATASSLTLTNVQLTNAGNYTVTASNSVNVAASATAVLTVTPAAPIPNSAYNLAGFAQGTTGGGVIPDTDTAYQKVFTPLDLANAIQSANKIAGSVKVIEIMNDLDLGWNEVGSAVQTLTSTPFRPHATPKLHPRLLTTGVSLIDIKSKSGLTIFSTNGATIRHACFNIKGTTNIIVRNLKFDEMWEWDEASKGNYDGNDWDFIDFGNGGTVNNIWLDHCTFTKSYDGEVDIKQGSFNITISWCKYTGDDGATNTNSWVRQQINYLEQSPASYPMYNFLRTHGFSVEDIVTICQGHDKTHLIGANSLKAENAQHTITFHHDLFMNPWDRLPRLRAGNVHNYNLYVDDVLGLAARRLRDARATSMSVSDQNTLNSTYNFKPFLNGSVSTENGAVLVEKSVYNGCLTPLRNNQTDPSNPIYTGKIQALDTIYQMHGTVVRGNSTDPGNPLGPFQAPVIAFSWNLPGNQLPYAYTPDDPSQLQTMLNAGAGSGAVTWDKTNWLRTSYPATAPNIIVDPQSQTVPVGQGTTFNVVVSGSAPFGYQWYFNTNSTIVDATSSILELVNLAATNAGTYSVVVTNSAGSTTSAFALLTVSSTNGNFTTWQNSTFTTEQLADPAISGPDATPAGDGVANLVKYALDLSPFVPAVQPLVAVAYTNGNGALTYHKPASVSDVTYLVEASTNLSGWTQNGVTQQLTGTDGNNLQTWRASYSFTDVRGFLRLKLIY